MASKRSKFKKKRSNPEAAKDMLAQGAAGFAGYAIGRFVGRLAFKYAVKSNPKLAPHAVCLGSGVAALATYYGANWNEKTAPYADSMTMGSGIAFAQSIVQSYLPALAILVSDPKVSEYLPSGNSAPAALPPTSAPRPALSDAQFDELLDKEGLEAIDLIPDESLGDYSDEDIDSLIAEAQE